MSRPGASTASKDEIKPAQVYELKLKTQQIQQQTRQMRTQLSRAQDKIVAQTNAINKTFEQNSDSSNVVSNHANTVPQLQRSVESAQNTLDELKKEIEQAKKDDKTFVVRELQEEDKIIYCEYTRLNQLIEEGNSQAQMLSNARENAEYRCSQKNFQNLRAQIGELQDSINSLRDKTNAYKSKTAKIEAGIRFNDETAQKKSVNQIKKEYNEKMQKINEDIENLDKQLGTEKENHSKQVAELQEIIDQMRQKIVNKLQNPDNGEEEEKGEKQNQEDEEKKEQ